MTFQDRPYEWKLLGICLVLILLSVVTMPWWTVDDAFISYRYGKNLVEVGRLTWNPGEPGLVEGYTGLLLPLLAASLLKLGLPLLDAIKVLGLLAAFGTVVFLLRGLRAAGVPTVYTWLACILLAANPLLTMHALSGLETSFFTLFLLGSYVLASEKKANGNATLLANLLLMLALLLCGLSRPEGIAWAVILTAGMIQRHARRNRTKTACDRRWIAAGLTVALLATYWVWRWTYYGHFFPNSYHAKVYDGFLNPESIGALAKFLVYYVSVPLALVFSLRIRAKKDTIRTVLESRHLLVPGILFIGIVLITYMRSNLWMNYGSRFFFPLLPLGLLLLLENVRWKRVAPQSATRRTWLIGLVAIQVALLAFRHVQERAFLAYYSRIVEEELVPASIYIRDHFPSGTKVASYMDAGALGFYSGMEVVDFGRLSDVYLAQDRPTEEQVVDYFFQCEPRVVLMTSWLEKELNYTDEAMAIAGDPRFRDYRFVRSWGNSVHYSYWQRLYVKE